MILLLAAIVAGVLIPVQAGVNASLRGVLGHPLLASLVNFLVGSVALAAASVAVRTGLPARTTLATAPWWMWVGGLLGATFVASATVLAPRLGAATLTATVVAGQMVASLWLDHHGVLGFPVQPITATRVVGAVLVLGGVLLVQRG